ncbi:hypothetical protein IEQ34_022566 [Dendrobium chrysotoxum]|uniref:Uncharacterized protein n=1 Tax=Dendrobium chrysotoxum TaxID=161865 RepID=A0AAV7FXM8_DENCH|nr:hypothetical protein IEQ34_022566 [Dendrobium chrysotoxum]
MESYPLSEPENKHVQELMDAIRLSFRFDSTNMGVKLEYKGHTNASKQGFVNPAKRNLACSKSGKSVNHGFTDLRP